MIPAGAEARGPAWRNGHPAPLFPPSPAEVSSLPDAVFAHAGCFLVVLDRDGRILRMNRSAERTCGHNASEVVGTPVWRYLEPPQEAARCRHLLERARSLGGNTSQAGPWQRTGDEHIWVTSPHESRWRTRDGGLRTLLWSKTAILDDDGEVVAVLGGGLDVTDQRAAEQRALEEERRARAAAEENVRSAALLLEASAILSHSLDLSTVLQGLVRLCAGRVADCCAVFLAEEDEPTPGLTSISPNAEESALARELMRWSRETEGQQALRKVMHAGTLATLRVGRKLNHDATLWMVPLVAHGHPVGVLVWARAGKDLTLRPTDEALFKDMAINTALATENARLYRKAQLATRLREEFMAIASHELRTPLTPIRLQVQLIRTLLRRPGAKDLPQLLELLDGADRQVVRLEKLVGALLDVSRISSGNLELIREPTDLGEVVRDVVARMAGAARAAGCRMEVVAPAPVVGNWDHLRVDQVVANLLDNALKYGAGRPVRVEVREEGPNAILSVHDEGIGVPSRDQARIFERFERAVPPSSYGGLGLGLYITRNIVEAHGGAIEVVSGQGQGATFTVTLPRWAS
ncbi:MAG: ATP-binding protein [Myxococcota bacterium]